jgi:hypothetical protein
MSESVGELQDWLDEHGMAWRSLRKPELLKFFAKWHSAFEPLFRTRKPDAVDWEAVRRVRERLPVDAMLFWLRGYEFTPSDSAHPSYALAVEGLAAVDPDVFNRHETIVAAQDLSFCCMFTHEAGELAAIQYWKRE